LRFIMRRRPKGIAVIASGHTADDIDVQVDQAKRYMETGLDAYVFISNRFAAAGESDELLLDRMIRVAGQLDPSVPLGIYECPYPYKRLMTPATLKALADTGRFCFLKDTCCDIEQIRARLKAMEGSGFKLFNANAATLLESLQAGCAGYSGVMGNFHPELYGWLCRNFAVHAADARAMQAFVGFASMAECQMYPVNAKYYLSLEGVPFATRCRAMDARQFTRNRQMEIEQMRAHTDLFKRGFRFAT
jgi:4-hydroxy-tetrahydrodipicolinate synthase